MPKFAKALGVFRIDEVKGKAVNVAHHNLSELVDPSLKFPSLPNLLHGGRSSGYALSEIESKSHSDEIGSIQVYLKPRLFENNYKKLNDLKGEEGVNFRYLLVPSRDHIRTLWCRLLDRARLPPENFPHEGTRHPYLIPELMKLEPESFSHFKAISYPVKFSLTVGDKDLSVVTIFDSAVVDGAKADWFEGADVSMGRFWKGGAPEE